MDKNLPARPNLDHLRRQAKTLLAALADRDADAATTIRENLPAAKGLSAQQVFGMPLRLADAQSAIARKSGFASWPQLARHVEQLRALEGTWAFTSLQVDGSDVPLAVVATSRLLMDGDRFRCESPGANYEGVFNIDVEANPHRIDIEFVEGPEAGNWNFGIFRIDGDTLEICLDMNGKPCPTEFRTTPGSGQAYETLRRVSHAKPESVTGGTPSREFAAPATGGCAPVASPTGAASGDATADFAYVESPLLTQLQGEWAAVALFRDGQEFPPSMCGTGRRSASGNELKVHFGGQLIIHAQVRLNACTHPIEIDYRHVSGPAIGMIQHGIMEWRGAEACFNMAAPGTPRPTDFTCPTGSGRTLSQWRRKD